MASSVRPVANSHLGDSGTQNQYNMYNEERVAKANSSFLQSRSQYARPAITALPKPKGN